jgi:hypothetical protein
MQLELLPTRTKGGLVIKSVLNKLLRRKQSQDLSFQLSQLLKDIQAHQASIDIFQADMEITTQHMEQVLQPDKFISAEWKDGSLHVKHHY